MKVIEQSDLRDEDGTISLGNRIKGTLNFGLDWYDKMQAQVDICDQLSKTLKREHTIICNATIPGTKLEIPLILLSPQGVRVIVPNGMRGSYRAKGDEWQVFDTRKRRFKRTKPNPMYEVNLMADVLLRAIQDMGFGLPGVEPILLFTNVNAHIDLVQPSVRIIQADAIDHFAANLLKVEPIMDQEDIMALSESIIHPRAAQVTKEPDLEPELELAPGLIESLDLSSPEPAEPVAPFHFPDTDPMDYPMYESNPLGSPNLGAPFYARWGLSRNQFLLLAAMAFMELIILTAIIVFVVANTFYS